MKQSVKRKLAKEILFFFGSALIAILICLTTFVYNNYLARSININENVINNISSQIDSIETLYPYIKILKNFNDNVATFIVEEKPVDVNTNDTSDFLKKYPGAIKAKTFILEKDTLDIPLNEINAFLTDIPDAKPLISMVPENVWNIYIEDKRLKALIIDDLNENKSRLLSESEMANRIKFIIISILILLYPIRLVVLLLLWAVRIVKQDPNESSG